jgi:transaldolase
MMSLESLIGTGTKVWLDGVDPDAIRKHRDWGITGATSNPTIVSAIVGKGYFDDWIVDLIDQGLTDERIAWALADQLVGSAQNVFRPVWETSQGDDGYVSFELDPLMEDENDPLPHELRVRGYVELGRKWAAGHENRMIKVPATDAGIDALEELAAAGVTLNVTLMFTERQYRLSRDAIWRGAQRRVDGLNDFKSVYSIFISRVDGYVETQLPELSPAARGQVGIATAKRVWRENQAFWKDKSLRLAQDIVFASTGVKNPADPPDKYVEALAGSDIQTNPPDTIAAIQRLNKNYTPKVNQPLSQAVETEMQRKVDTETLGRVLLDEGKRKFVEPQRALLKLIAAKRDGRPTTASPGRLATA